jgi:hypothetical protein
MASLVLDNVPRAPSPVARDITVVRYRDAADINDPPQTTHALRAEITLGSIPHPDLSHTRIYPTPQQRRCVRNFRGSRRPHGSLGKPPTPPMLSDLVRSPVIMRICRRGPGERPDQADLSRGLVDAKETRARGVVRTELVLRESILVRDALDVHENGQRLQS